MFFRNRIRLFTLMRIRILILITVLQTYDHCYTDPPGPHFETLKLPKFDFNADPSPVFQFNADPDTDPTSKIMRIYAELDPHWSENLCQTILILL
jgi:hypothetical protein